MTTTPLFTSFSSVDKEEWLKAIQRELKKEQLQDFDWQLSQEILITPFAHSNDSIELYEPVIKDKSTNTWEIAEFVKVNHAKDANQLAIEALEQGANALIFDLTSDFVVTDMPVLLKNIQHEWISTHFMLDIDKLSETIDAFTNLLASTQQNTALVKGSFRINTAPSPEIALLKSHTAALPLFQFITIFSANYYQSKNNVADEVGMTLFTANKYLEKLPPSDWNRLQFVFLIDESYFLNIAKLRAFRLLLQFLTVQYQVETTYSPIIEVNFAKNSYGDNMYSNMITATTMAMSAAIGGANRVSIRPADAEKESDGTAFTRRIARNVHHLMQLESHLDHVVDPAAGSYYIENITNKVAEAAWKVFQTQILEEKAQFGKQ